MNQVAPVEGSHVERSSETRAGSLDMLDDLHVGVCCCDARGSIVLFNRRAVELWGQTPEPGARYDAAHRLYTRNGEVVPIGRGPVSTVLRTGIPVHDERFVIERVDGTRVPVVVSVDPLLDEHGVPTGVVSCFRDATEPAFTRTEMDEGGDLEDFFENAPVGLHIIGADGTILRANNAELQNLGYTAAEYVGHHVTEFYADPTLAEDILSRLGRGEELERFPVRLRAKDGSIRHVLITSNAQFRNGKFVRTRCFTYDVTDLRLAEARTQESERRSQSVLEAMPTAIYTTDAAGRVTFFNEACVELAGRRPEIGIDQWCIAWRLYATDGAPISPDQCPMAIALKEARPVRGAELIVERPDGRRANVIPYPTPLFDRNGRLTGAVNMLVDVTEKHQAYLHSAYLASIVASSDDAIIGKTLDGIVTSWNAGATRIFGYEAHEMLGQHITRIVPPELHGEEEEVLAKLRRGERIEHYETVRVAKDGRQIDISLTVSPIRDRFGRIVGASKISRDITERKRSEEMQRLLIGELNHRVKNTLATVQSMASQTVHSAKSPGDFMTSFMGRLRALAQTNTILTQTSWQGADIQEIIRHQLLLGGEDDSQISLDGPTVVLDPQAALHLALVVHELGTNARKYGALSTPAGRLSICWAVRRNGGETLLLSWREGGGPRVSKPTEQGFGTTLIHQSLSAHDGEVILEYPPEGVTCEIRLPLPDGRVGGAYRSHAPGIAPSATGKRAPARARSATLAKLQRARVIVVEDEPLVAIDVVSILSNAGCEVIGPAATLDSAKSLVETAELDLAILDANLAGESVDELAGELARRGIPFAFLTGYGPDCLPEEFQQVPLIDKPFNPQQLLAVVDELLQQGSANGS